MGAHFFPHVKLAKLKKDSSGRAGTMSLIFLKQAHLREDV